MKKVVFIVLTIGLFFGLLISYLLFDNKDIEEKEILMPWDLYENYLPKAYSIIDGIILNEDIYGISKDNYVELKDLTNEEKNVIVLAYLIETGQIYEENITFNKFDLVGYELFKEHLEREEFIKSNSMIYLKENDNTKSFDNIGIIKEYINIKNVLKGNIRTSYKKGDLIYFDIPLTYLYSDNEKVSYSKDSKFNSIYCEETSCINKLEYKTYRITFKLDETDNKYKFISSKVMVNN